MVGGSQVFAFGRASAESNKFCRLGLDFGRKGERQGKSLHRQAELGFEGVEPAEAFDHLAILDRCRSRAAHHLDDHRLAFADGHRSPLIQTDGERIALVVGEYHQAVAIAGDHAGKAIASRYGDGHHRPLGALIPADSQDAHQHPVTMAGSSHRSRSDIGIARQRDGLAALG